MATGVAGNSCAKNKVLEFSGKSPIVGSHFLFLLMLCTSSRNFSLMGWGFGEKKRIWGGRKMRAASLFDFLSWVASNTAYMYSIALL
jgi:hypothetical protein